MNEYKVWLAKLVTIGVFLLVLLPLLAGVFAAVEKSDGRAVAVVKVQGVIEDSTDALAALYKQAADDEVPAIVLRVDSPGGAVGPSEELYHAVRRLKAKKPIVVSMGSVAASGGLYAALGGSKILCQPGTQTGSIGVVMQVPNFTSIAGKVGFDMITVKSGAMKDVGNPFRPMSDTDRAFLEGTAAKVHDTFIRAVMEGRNLPEEKVRQFADGRVIIGSEAKELGLVDDFGDIYDAATLALSLAGVELPAGQLPKLKFANKEKNALSQLLESVSSVPEIISHTSQVPVLKYLATGY